MAMVVTGGRRPATAGGSRVSLLADVIRLASDCRDEDELVESSPELAANLGFDRAFVSLVDNGTWAPAAVFVRNDRKWADDIRAAGCGAPSALGHGLVEDQMLTTMRPIVVRDAQVNPWVNRSIASASRSRGYIAAPIRVAGGIAGFLHVDRYWSPQPLDATDVACVGALADTLGISLARFGAARPRERRSGSARTPVFAEHLTRREYQVAELISDGLTNPQIAQRLCVAETTVKSHVKHLLRKLGARHRAELVATFLRDVV